jgi:hypothetical protein
MPTNSTLPRGGAPRPQCIPINSLTLHALIDEDEGGICFIDLCPVRCSGEVRPPRPVPRARLTNAFGGATICAVRAGAIGAVRGVIRDVPAGGPLDCRPAFTDGGLRCAERLCSP